VDKVPPESEGHPSFSFEKSSYPQNVYKSVFEGTDLGGFVRSSQTLGAIV